MVLTTNGKNWLATHAGVSNCFAASGITYTDPDGTKTAGTGDIVNTLELLHEVGMDSFTVIAGTNYAQFKVINDNNDIDLLNDVAWAYANDGHLGSGTAYCYVAPPALHTITIDSTSTSVQVGSDQQLTVACLDQYGAAITCSTPLIWESSDPTKATIDSTGKVTGVAVGTAGMTASYGSVTSNQLTITVTQIPPALHTITIGSTSTSVQVGSDQQLTVACLDQYGAAITCSTPLIWESSDPTKATVDSSGLVTGVAAGTAGMTARYGLITSNQLTITVTQIPPALHAITISPASASVHIGDTQQLTAICLDQYGATLTCPTPPTWSSGSPLIAGVSDSGLVTGLAEGSSSITAMVSDTTSSPSVISVTIPLPPPTEAGFGPFLIGGLIVGALLMNRESPTRPTRESPTQMSKTKSAQVSRSNISNN